MFTKLQRVLLKSDEDEGEKEKKQVSPKNPIWRKNAWTMPDHKEGCWVDLREKCSAKCKSYFYDNDISCVVMHYSDDVRL